MILDKFKLNGKTALVTGGGGGIGQSIAAGFAQAGADIAVAYRTDASETKELVEAAGAKFYGIKTDLTKMSSIPCVVEEVINRFGKIDILVNNAGMIRREDALSFSEQDWDDVMNINLKVSYFLTQAVAKQMVENKLEGKIISIASVLSFQGGIRTASYTASKAGIKGLTMTLANEWAKYGVNVNAIAPGYISTKLTTDLRGDEDRSNDILKRIPAGRWGEPEDIQGVALLLASDAAKYINGFTVVVDGGWLGR